ncbi:MAG: phage tail protein [Clostridiales bacterium]|nr:phage tail protein [Clostridiales bacterium]
MANFKTTIITKKGHALMAKLSANVATMKFTKVCSSDFDYSNLNNSELEQVVTFKNLKQTVLPDLIKVVNTTTVKVNATITNTNLTEGYYLRTIGLFALDPDEGEILYSITPTSEADYMAADNGITKSGISLDLLTTISNSENVNLQIDPNATISADTFYNVVGDVAALENEGSNLVDGINKNTTSLNENVNNITSIKSDKTFMFCNLSATTIATEGVCKISSISINNANWFELTSDGKLKCLVSGKYRFYCKAYISNAPVGGYELQLRRNETDVEIEMVNVTTTGNTTNRVFMLINAQQDQIIDVYLHQTSGSSVTISPDARFSKIYIERIGDL